MYVSIIWKVLKWPRGQVYHKLIRIPKGMHCSSMRHGFSTRHGWPWKLLWMLVRSRKFNLWRCAQKREGAEANKKTHGRVKKKATNTHLWSSFFFQSITQQERKFPDEYVILSHLISRLSLGSWTRWSTARAFPWWACRMDGTGDSIKSRHLTHTADVLEVSVPGLQAWSSRLPLVCAWLYRASACHGPNNVSLGGCFREHVWW